MIFAVCVKIVIRIIPGWFFSQFENLLSIQSIAATKKCPEPSKYQLYENPKIVQWHRHHSSFPFVLMIIRCWLNEPSNKCSTKSGVSLPDVSILRSVMKKNFSFVDFYFLDLLLEGITFFINS